MRSGKFPLFYIASPRSASRLARALDPEAEWCYLGTSIRRRERVARSLSNGRRRSIAAELDAVVARCKQPFLDWLEALGRRQRDRVSWWASTLASRSTLQTDCFLLFCYAELVMGWLGGRGSPPLVIVVEDPWLVLALKRRLGADSRAIFLFGDGLDLGTDSLYWLARAPLSVAHTIFYAVAAYLLSRLLPRMAPGEGPRHVLIQTWIDERCFGSDETFRDPYSGRLEALLGERGESVLRITHWHVPPALILRLGAISGRFIIAPQYFSLLDVIRASMRIFRIDGMLSSERLQGWDMRPFLMREVLHEWGHPAYTRHHLAYLCARRVASGWADRVKSLVYVFENQPWEKMLCLAWREAAPGVRLIGQQHSSVPPLLLNYFLGRRESEIMPFPDQVVVNSVFNQEVLEQAGYPGGAIINGGALRYEHLYTNVPDETASVRTTGRRVLVAFPTCAPYALALLTDLLDEFRRPLPSGSGEVPVQFVLKCHPLLPIEKFYPGRMDFPSWISVSRQPMESLIPGADALLYVPQTASWWEGFLAGIPVIKYQTDMLDIDSSAALGHRGPVVCTRETLREALANVLHQAGPRRPTRENLSRFFGKVDEDVWARVVGAQYEKGSDGISI